MVQWLRLHAPSAGSLVPIPGQGTTYYMPQLRVHMSQLKIPHAATKILRQGITHHSFWVTMASLVAQTVKNPPAMQETRVQSLGQEDPLEKEMATYSSILAGKIPWTEEPGGLQSMELQRVGHD